MDEQRLREIEERSSKATPGPWTAKRHRLQMFLNAPDPSDPEDPEQTLAVFESCWDDHEFCAHARTDVPDLVAEVRRLRTELQMFVWMNYPALYTAYKKETTP